MTTPTIIDHPSPNHSPRKGGRVDTIVIHHTANSADGGALVQLTDPTHITTGGMPRSPVSAHYLVGAHGAVYRLVAEHLKAWHAGKGRLPWETCPEYDFNHRSIGIEVVNPGDGVTPFTEAQYAALAWLMPDIVRRLRLDPVVVAGEGHTSPVRHLPGMVYILGHRDVSPGRKTDPADNFDWGRIRAALAGGVA